MGDKKFKEVFKKKVAKPFGKKANWKTEKEMGR